MISILHNKRLCPGTMTDHVHQLISMISCKNVPVLVGRSACIDERHNVYLPPLPKDATEKDFLLYFKSGIHEQAHIYGGSDFKRASKDKVHFGLENAIEDIRCENLQEKEYPGIKSYRIQAYQYILDDFLNAELFNADPSKDIKGFVRALGKFIIIHIRKVQLQAPQLTMTPSDALIKAYYAHVADLESRLISMSTIDEMYDLSGIVYDRLKDIIKEELEKSQSQKGSSDDLLSDDGGCGDPIHDPEDTDEESRGTEGPEDTSEKSSENKSQENDSNETPQEKELVNGEESEQDKSGESGEEDSDSGTGKSADESEESGSEEGGEGTGDAGDQLPPGKSSTDEEVSGNSLPDETNEVSYDDDKGNGEGHGTEETGDDQGNDMRAEGVTHSGTNRAEEDSTKDATFQRDPDRNGDKEEGEEINNGHVNSNPLGDGSDNDLENTGDGHSNASGSISENDGQTSGKDGDDHASECEINKRVQKLIDDLNASDESFDIMTGVNKALNSTSTNDLPYMVDPSVKDVIIYGREVTDMEGTLIRDTGIKMLGSKGAQLTKLFISQTKPRIMYNRTAGNLDVLSFATDMMDNREDVFKNLTGAKLDKAAVSFMVDNSSSMRAIIGDMYSILSGILQIMSRACIPTEAIGYTAEETESEQWRDIPAHLTIIKEFRESYSGKVLRRCAPPDFMGLTNDLDCMRFCVPRLWARPEKKKVLIVLCDGSPYLRSSVLTEKLQRSYKEYIDVCRKAGIIVFGIGIGADLSEYFGEDFAMVDTMNVGEVLMTKLTKILNKGRG